MEDDIYGGHANKRVLMYIILSGCIGAVVCLGWYLHVLYGRIKMTEFGTSVGMDVIVAFHILGITAVVGSVFAQKHFKLKLGWLVCFTAILIEITFFLMNWFGYVWEYQKGTPESLYAAIVKLMAGMMGNP